MTDNVLPPPSKDVIRFTLSTAQVKGRMVTVKLLDGEAVRGRVSAWDTYGVVIRRYGHHRLLRWDQIQEVSS